MAGEKDDAKTWTLPTKAGEELALSHHEDTLVAVLTLCQDSLGLLCLSPPLLALLVLPPSSCACTPRGVFVRGPC